MSATASLLDQLAAEVTVLPTDNGLAFVVVLIVPGEYVDPADAEQAADDLHHATTRP